MTALGPQQLRVLRVLAAVDRDVDDPPPCFIDIASRAGGPPLDDRTVLGSVTRLHVRGLIEHVGTAECRRKGWAITEAGRRALAEVSS